MTDITPSVPHEPARFSVDAYFDLVERGVIGPEERVELLEGVIVSMPPSGPLHATIVSLFAEALIRAVDDRAAVRSQLTMVFRPTSAPEPDVAVVTGAHRDYLRAHPSTALLVVEVSDSSLAQDRLSKSRIYAQAGIPEYWVVNLRDGVVEVMRDPDPELALYRETRQAARDERLEISTLPGVGIDLARLLPEPEPRAF
jgi:Uma2 family endonuclease